jgi:hypothetical protein
MARAPLRGSFARAIDFYPHTEHRSDFLPLKTSLRIA